MSGGTTERVGEPTLADHVARIRNLVWMRREWGTHELGPQIEADLAQYRSDFPEAAATYDAEEEARQLAQFAMIQQRAGETAIQHV